MLSLKTLPLVSEKLRKSRGVYTDEQIDRCCQIGGQFGAALESLFSCNVGSERTVHSRHSTRDITHDVHVFLKNYVSDKLWNEIPKRQHNGFEKIRHEWKIKDSKKLAKRLLHRSERLDMWRKFVV